MDKENGVHIHNTVLVMNKMKVCRFQPQKSIKEMIISEVREGEASIMMSPLDGI